MKVVFLDRDGTIIKDPADERVDHLDKIELFPDTLEALRLLKDNDYSVVLVTNQAGISEGLIDEAGFHIIHDEVLRHLEPCGVTILKTYMCPHGPDDGCVCRKPKPNMLQWAAKEFDIDLSKCWMIGDRPSDVLAGINAGAKGMLVQTANHAIDSPDAQYVAPNLFDAVKHVIAS